MAAHGIQVSWQDFLHNIMGVNVSTSMARSLPHLLGTKLVVVTTAFLASHPDAFHLFPVIPLPSGTEFIMEAVICTQAITLRGVNADVMTAGNAHNVLQMARSFMSIVQVEVQQHSERDFAASPLHCALDYHFFGADKYKLPSYAWIPQDLRVSICRDGLSNTDLFEAIVEFVNDNVDVELFDTDGNPRRVAPDGILQEFHIKNRDELCEWIRSVWNTRNDDLACLKAPKDEADETADIGSMFGSVMSLLGGGDGPIPSFSDMMEKEKEMLLAAEKATAAVEDESG